jgi:uncharacterized protein YutE (UPF0331/DUF86 family)
MPLNPEIVRAGCADIGDALSKLTRFAAMPVNEFVANQDAVDAACYRLLVGIEAAQALCQHVAATRQSQVSEQYATCFNTLLAAGVVSPELAVRLQMLARIRNLLVHMYAKVEPAWVYEILREHMTDLRAFVRTISRLVDPPTR